MDTVKQRGEGVAVYVNECWCTQGIVKERFWGGHLEYLVVSCRSFYLPREFNNVIIITVHIPAGANDTVASELLLDCVNKYENSSPKGVMIALGDFNHCDFQPCVPIYQQTVTSLTRGHNILDNLCCNVRNSYCANKKPKLVSSDHNMVFLAPIYKENLKGEQCAKISVENCETENVMSLQGCFDCTECDVLYSDSDDRSFNLNVLNS